MACEAEESCLDVTRKCFICVLYNSDFVVINSFLSIPIRDQRHGDLPFLCIKETHHSPSVAIPIDNVLYEVMAMMASSRIFLKFDPLPLSPIPKSTPERLVCVHKYTSKSAVSYVGIKMGG